MKLQLSGLVVKHQGTLKPFNRIYESVFNLNWIEKELAKLRPYYESFTAWLASVCQDDSRLLRGQALQDALIWATNKSLSDGDYQFLAASQELDKREVQIALDAQKKTNQVLTEVQREAAQILRKSRISLTWRYILSLSLVILGTMGGLIVGEHYDDKGVEQFRIAQERYHQIERLEKAIREVKFHQQWIIYISENQAPPQTTINQLLASLLEVSFSLSQLEYELKSALGNSGEETAKLKTLLQTVDIELASYIELVRSILQQANNAHTKTNNSPSKNSILWKTITGNQEINLEKISNSLDHLFHSIRTQQELSQASFRRAKILRLIIIIMSLVLSTAITAILTYFYTQDLLKLANRLD